MSLVDNAVIKTALLSSNIGRVYYGQAGLSLPATLGRQHRLEDLQAFLAVNYRRSSDLQ